MGKARGKRPRFSARERQIMDVLYRLGEGTVNDVLQAMDDAPSRSAVRTFLRILEEKGFVKHAERGREYVYRPRQPRGRAGQSAIHRLLQTFFDGSLEKAVASYLSAEDAEVSTEELRRLEALIREARTKGR